MSDNIQQTVVDLLNQASLYGKDNLRVQHLRHVQELILRKDPNLLDHFLDEVLTFQTDKSIEIKKSLISFVEEACQLHPELIMKVIDNLHFLLYDDNIFVQKKLILSFISIYKSTLIWLAKSRLIDENVETMWRSLINIKNHIISKLNSDNNGLCIVIIKFMEMLVINLSEYEQDFLGHDQRILSRNKLEQEGHDTIEKLIEFTLSQTLANNNLTAGIEAITNIARYRSDCIKRVVQTLEMLQSNLPLTLNDSQVDSVRKIIKLKLFNLLKHSMACDLQSEIINLLTNLGATQSEILKHLPKTSSEAKRKIPSNANNKNSKKTRNINEDANNNFTEVKTSSCDIHTSHFQHQPVTDLVEKLSITNVVDLVLVSMRLLPEEIPASFQAIYTPITDAGSPAHIEYLAQLLSAQLTAAVYEPKKCQQYSKSNFSDVLERKPKSNKTDIKHDDSLPTAATAYIDGQASFTSTFTNRTIMPRIPPRKTKSYRLFHAIKPMEYDEIQRMSIDAFHRLLHAEDICEKIGIRHIHQNLISSLVCLFGESFRHIYKDYIIADIHQRYDLVFAWIYQEYIHANGNLTKYDNILCLLLEDFQGKDNHLFSRLLTNVPLITDNALLILKRYCQNETCFDLGLKILRHLISHRLPMREKCLDILINLTQNEKNFLRNNAIEIAKSLYEKKQLKEPIERHALKFLRVGPISEVVFDVSRDSWAEESISLCFSLYLRLIPLNHCLIQPLASIYTEVNENTKQIILRILENPVREMGMTSPEILKLIKNCPKGAETLIIHMIDLLIERIPPSNELIENIRHLYHERIPDVRFLMPVLTNLEKREIIAALPKLIKLPPSVVKDVFSQLLGLNVSTKMSHTGSISPYELLIALHEISLEECELKTIINATSLCFNERSIYTNDLLAEIIQQLVEMTPIPILFMRTVLQTLCLYPKMVPFIMNILQRLITKQVWKQARIWEGFIKCCEKTRPHSFPLLLQLPLSQLKHAFQIEAKLHDSLQHHLRSMSSAQRSSIPLPILTVIEDNSENIGFLPSSS